MEIAWLAKESLDFQSFKNMFQLVTWERSSGAYPIHYTDNLHNRWVLLAVLCHIRPRALQKLFSVARQRWWMSANYDKTESSTFFFFLVSRPLGAFILLSRYIYLLVPTWRANGRFGVSATQKSKKVVPSHGFTHSGDSQVVKSGFSFSVSLPCRRHSARVLIFWISVRNAKSGGNVTPYGESGR